jgi:ankyrin repeat protein
MDIIEASRYGNINRVRALVKYGANLNVTTTDNITALMYASFFEHIEIVALLIKAGAKVNIKNNFNETALRYATANDNIKIVNLLLKSGANIDYAIIGANPRILKIFLKHTGVDPNIKCQFTGTALTVSTRRGNIKCVLYLLKAGADTTKKDLYGFSALKFALIYKTRIAKLLQKAILIVPFLSKLRKKINYDIIRESINYLV